MTISADSACTERADERQTISAKGKTRQSPMTLTNGRWMEPIIRDLRRQSYCESFDCAQNKRLEAQPSRLLVNFDGVAGMQAKWSSDHQPASGSLKAAFPRRFWPCAWLRQPWGSRNDSLNAS